MTVLAEKLAARKDLVLKIGRLDDEIAEGMIYDEGATPEETEGAAAEAMANYKAGERLLIRALDDLQAIEDEIRAANVRTIVPFEGATYSISEAIVYRDRLKTEYAARHSIASAAEETVSRKRNRYDFNPRKKDDIRTLSALSPKALRDEADRVARRLRLLDVEIQKVNWSTDI